MYTGPTRPLYCPALRSALARDVGVIEAKSRRVGNKRNAAAAMGSDEGRAFFRGSIHIGGNELPVPVQLFRPVGLVVNVDSHWLAFFQAQQRARKLAVVGGRGDDAIRSELNGLDRDGEGVVRRSRCLRTRPPADAPKPTGQRGQQEGAGKCPRSTLPPSGNFDARGTSLPCVFDQRENRMPSREGIRESTPTFPCR